MDSSAKSLSNARYQNPFPVDFPLDARLRICDSPEAQLIYAIILSVWNDSNKKIDCLARQEARRWFFSAWFYDYCELINFPPNVIQEYVTKSWRQT